MDPSVRRTCVDVEDVNVSISQTQLDERPVVGACKIICVPLWKMGATSIRLKHPLHCNYIFVLKLYKKMLLYIIIAISVVYGYVG